MISIRVTLAIKVREMVANEAKQLVRHRARVMDVGTNIDRRLIEREIVSHVTAKTDDGRRPPRALLELLDVHRSI